MTNAEKLAAAELKRIRTAGPELLAALKMLVTEVEAIRPVGGFNNQGMTDAINWTYAAIAKAEG